MHVATATALVVTALIASAYLVAGKGERLYAAIALLATAVEALIVFDILKISVKHVRFDIGLAAVVAVAGCLCWFRSSTKGAISAATVVALIGLIQLFSALHVLR